PTGEDGNIDWESLEAAVSDRTAGLMITNPSTLGLFEQRILDIERLIHGVDGLLYYDGANLNGILGHARPGDMGFDVAHVNLHKTFSSPHGGGGPGAGPVCVRDRSVKGGVRLSDLLPGPVVVREGSTYRLRWPGRESVGLLRSFQANTLVIVWAYTYILSLGAVGLRVAGEVSVLNANYFARKLLSRTRGGYTMPYGGSRPRKHEVVISCERLREETGVTAEDVAKALLDSGLHAPTIYFPLIVREALMFEFTESEPKEVLDAYVERLLEIEEKARRDPEGLKRAPTSTSSLRVDNVRANHPKTVTPTWRVEMLRRQGVIGPLR
ncbi:MAG: aminomethyl-transferring glycine dehydrogenase subunit GcvPB, partial [Desulfurococcales archaeon]|nr:aminomethyl-transferring glycine dehydrogenase subunit GcvPB [Desulfurococcales archaeon]